MTRGFPAWVRSVAVLVVLASTGSLVAQTLNVGANFTGATRSNSGGWNPPDTQGAVGPNHFVEFVNNRFAVYNKGTGAVITNSSLDQFWASSTYTFQGNTFDPRVYFDRASGRWFASVNDGLGVAQANSGILVAVSAAADPTGTWNKFRFDADTPNTRWADYSTMGVSRDWITVSTNMFPIAGGGASTDVSFLTIPKASLLGGTTTGSKYVNPAGVNSFGFTAHPASDLAGNTATGYLLSTFNSSTLRLSTITGTASNPTITGTNFIAVTNLGNPPPVDQPDTTTNISPGDNRTGSTPVLVNGKLWAVRGVNNGGTTAAIAWVRINPATGTLEEQGIVPTPAGLGVYFPALAVNGDGDIVLGFSGSNGSTFPSAYAITARYNGSSGTGAVTWGTAVQTQAGLSHFESGGRFGDYSQTTVDPADPGIFWSSQEYVSATDVWAVRHTELTPQRVGQVRWANPANGNWATGANWYTGAAPTATDHVILSRFSATNYAVTLPAGATSVDRLSVRQTGSGTVTFNLNSGTLNLTNTGTGTPSLAISEFQGTSNVTFGGGTLNSQTTTIASEVGGVGNLTFAGVTAAMTWNNAGSVYVGGSSAAAGGIGTLTIAGATATVSGTTVLYNSGGTANALTVNGGGTFTTGGLTNNTSGGSVVPVVTLTGASSTLRVNGSFDSSFGGQIVGTGVVNKQGTGTFTLTGNTNTYSGGTSVTAGILAAANASGSATGTGAVTVSGTGTLAGTGFVNGATTVNAGGTIRGGTGTGTGTLTVANNVTLTGAASNGGRLQAVASRTGANAAAASLVNLTGASSVLNLGAGGAKFRIDLRNGATSLTLGETYTITLASVATAGNIQLDGASQAANSTIANSAFDLTSADFAVQSGYTLQVDGTGRNLRLTFTPVPEPGTVFALGTAVLGGGALLRRRWRKATPLPV